MEPEHCLLEDTQKGALEQQRSEERSQAVPLQHLAAHFALLPDPQHTWPDKQVWPPQVVADASRVPILLRIPPANIPPRSLNAFLRGMGLAKIRAASSVR